jgi:hypothetical protein
MPRLKYYKNYDWNYEKGAYPNDNIRDEQSSPRDTTESRQYENIEYDDEDSGNNWLSNRAIISSFTNDKLRQAIKHYRTLLRLFESELLQRSFTPSKHPSEDRITHRQLRKEQSEYEGKKTSPSRHGDISTLRSIRKMLKQLKLSPEEKRKLFETWTKIQKEAEND